MNKKEKVAKSSSRRCPKCGAEMVQGVCQKCEYTAKTAYKNRREAKEFTYAG
jgi:PHP family Zn ribbon phosphoesterase